MKKLTISIIALALLATVVYPGVSNANAPIIDTKDIRIDSSGSIARRPCMAIDSNLSFGSRDGVDTSVNRMQLILKLYGFLKVEPTGYFGMLTREAVKDFQKAHGLPPTGFFGPLSRGVIKKLTCADDMPVSAITYMVNTDKTSYTQDEKIVVTVKVYNTTDTAQTLNFTNGCQTDYTVAGYNYLASRSCIQAVSGLVIKAHSSHTWTMTHNPDEFKIPVGTHTLVGKVVGNGEAKTTITIKGEVPTVTVTSPNGGESFTIGSGTKTTKIKWKAYMPYPTFAEVRYNIYLHRQVECNTQACPMIAYAPYTITERVRGDSYEWKVGLVESSTGPSEYVGTGKYWIQVCMEGGQTCDMSDTTFKINQIEI